MLTLKRLYSFLYRTVGSPVILREGVKYRLQPHRGRVDLRVLTGKHSGRLTWEYLETGYLAQALAHFRADCFIDAGAYFGYYAVLMAKHGFSGEIFAVEALSANFHRLRKHIALNNLDGRITTIHVALGDSESTVKMNMPWDGDPTGAHVMNSAEGESVRSTKMDTLFPWQGRRIAIKMDLEGSELQALHGAHHLLTENIVLLQIEVFPQHLSVIRHLLATGFRLIYYHGANFFFTNASVTDFPTDDLELPNRANEYLRKVTK